MDAAFPTTAAAASPPSDGEEDVRSKVVETRKYLRRLMNPVARLESGAVPPPESPDARASPSTGDSDTDRDPSRGLGRQRSAAESEHPLEAGPLSDAAEPRPPSPAVPDAGGAPHEPGPPPAATGPSSSESKQKGPKKKRKSNQPGDAPQRPSKRDTSTMKAMNEEARRRQLMNLGAEERGSAAPPGGWAEGGGGGGGGAGGGLYDMSEEERKLFRAGEEGALERGNADLAAPKKPVYVFVPLDSDDDTPNAADEWCFLCKYRPRVAGDITWFQQMEEKFVELYARRTQREAALAVKALYDQKHRRSIPGEPEWSEASIIYHFLVKCPTEQIEHVMESKNLSKAIRKHLRSGVMQLNTETGVKTLNKDGVSIWCKLRKEQKEQRSARARLL